MKTTTIGAAVLIAATVMMIGIRIHASRGPEPGSVSESPSAITKRFFERTTPSAMRSETTRPAPDSFLECRDVKRDECAENRKRTRSQVDDGSLIVAYAVEQRPSLMLGRYLTAIESGRVEPSEANTEIIDGNEARVRVAVIVDGNRLLRDVLLVSDGEWRIFEICFTDEFENYAPFKSRPDPTH